MLEALCEGKPIRAAKDLKGKNLVFRCKDQVCEYPELELVVGNHRRAYFRHRRRGMCSCPDGETDWHLEWKSHFDQIEVDMGVDEVTGERNRADAVVGNLVLEFQHSPLKDAEKNARERYYGSKGGMLWIVDASNKRSLQRIDKMISKHGYTREYGHAVFDDSYFQILFPEESLPQTWWERECGIVFDYGVDRKCVYKLPQNSYRNNFICRWFDKEELIATIKREPKYFIKSPGLLVAEHQALLRRQAAAEAEARARDLAAKRAKAEDEKRRKIEARNAMASAFMKLSNAAREKAIARQKGKGRDQWALERVGDTQFYTTAWGEYFVRDKNHQFVRTFPRFE